MPHEQRTIHVWAEDKPGVLMRVANTVTAKGANIDRLIVNADPLQIGVSKITIIATLESHLHRRVVDEMNRLVNVLLAVDVSGSTAS